MKNYVSTRDEYGDGRMKWENRVDDADVGRAGWQTHTHTDYPEYLQKRFARMTFIFKDPYVELKTYSFCPTSGRAFPDNRKADALDLRTHTSARIKPCMDWTCVRSAWTYNTLNRCKTWGGWFEKGRKSCKKAQHRFGDKEESGPRVFPAELRVIQANGCASKIPCPCVRFITVLLYYTLLLAHIHK